MKKVKVRYINLGIENDEVVEGILFEDISDIKLIRKELDRAERGVMVKFIKSGETENRLDHIISGFRPLEKSIAKLAITYSNTRQQNPIYLLGECSEMYLKTLTSQLIKGEQMFMNAVGGLCPVEGSLEIVEMEDFTEFPNPPKYYISNNSEVINLENDFELEKTACEYMNKNFKGYSYITDMKSYSDRDFEGVFKKFKEQGGTKVYVYTTGIDHEQMYEYSKHALKAGLKDFIFDFNCGMDDKITTFVEWLEQRGNVKLLNN